LKNGRSHRTVRRRLTEKTFNNGEIRNKSWSVSILLSLLVKPSPFLDSKMTMLLAAGDGFSGESTT
jgi:hypothetical protein